MAPVVLELRRLGFDQLLVHTGQHYDASMSQVFFDELDMPRPDIYLNVGSGTHAKQTAAIMSAFEDTCLANRPTLVVVAGDVNSTLAAALVAAKLHVPVAHIESGLRSFDRSMPEEVNRVVTDHLSDLLFATEPSAVSNLKREGVANDKVHFVGNCMVDSLLKHISKAVELAPWKSLGLHERSYALLTLHRPSNVDDSNTLSHIVDVINSIATEMPVVFPVHPRTRWRLTEIQNNFDPRVVLTEPQSYLTFLGLIARARCVLTDSGGIQEETTALKVPCLTLRENTERPITLLEGSNRLVGTERTKILHALEDLRNGRWSASKVPQLWDGRAASRIVNVISAWLQRCGG